MKQTSPRNAMRKPVSVSVTTEEITSWFELSAWAMGMNSLASKLMVNSLAWVLPAWQALSN